MAHTISSLFVKVTSKSLYGTNIIDSSHIEYYRKIREMASSARRFVRGVLGKNATPIFFQKSQET